MKTATLLLALLPAVLATPVSLFDNEQYVLGDNIQLPKSYPGFDLDLSAPRLVQLDGEGEPVVMTELEKILAKAGGARFFDVTETPNLGSRAHLRALIGRSYPEPNNTEVVRSVIETLQRQNLRVELEKFTSFYTRYYRSLVGKEAQQWLMKRISEITEQSAPKSLQSLISIQEFPHSWPQSSVIVRINGSSPTDDGVVILGAHLDSTGTSPFLRSPGADDDGSGSINILETYRALIAAGFQPDRTVEFHWYSGEEGGLLGSQAIAQDYEQRDVNVIAMAQFDMTAWVKRGTREQVGIVTDYTDPVLTEYNKKLVDLYLDIPWIETQCGQVCSDHASWGKAGYPGVFNIESDYKDVNRGYVHTENDRYDVSDEFSFTHMLEFSKLAVAFAIELGGWTGNLSGRD
ncbi:peptidase [Pilatotrama ljubarskyi]|nr:peptidase [Pilatotrama ljubarskyi]